LISRYDEDDPSRTSSNTGAGRSKRASSLRRHHHDPGERLLPEEALKIANAVVSASEQLVNSMSTRATRDAMDQAQNELVRAERRLGDVRFRCVTCATLNLRSILAELKGSTS
jgi:hypothetical protein